MPTPPAPDRMRRRDARHRDEDRLSRGEYLRIFAEGEDSYEAVRPQRALAESRNSELDSAMRDKRMPAYGVFRQILWMVGFYNGGNIVNEHYVTAHAVPGSCADRFNDSDTQVVIVEQTGTAAQPVVRSTVCPSRSAGRRPASTRPWPSRPRPGRPSNRR